MKKLQIKIKKGECIGHDEIAIIEGHIMNSCIQFDGTEAREPEDLTFLRAKENIEIIVKNWRMG